MMKLVFLFLLLGTSFVWANTSYAQRTSLALYLNNVELEEVFDAIRRQSEFEFFYSNDQVNTSTRVSVNLRDADITKVLDHVLPAMYEYKINDRYILIGRKKEQPQVHQSVTQLAKRQITGTVADATGEPVIGANIREKGTTNGTITDIDGRFALSITGNAVLEISYIGFISQEVSTTGRTTISVLLKEDNQALDEVVVVGYGTMKKSDLTGAVVSANLKDFEKAPNTNIIQSLQGTVPGLNIGQITETGATPSISIRGTNTLSGNKDVLIILDGIIYNSPLSALNPNDIESIDILKDASATAVYGAQAANGVLLITSKKGKAGKTKVSFSSSYSFSNPTKDLRPMNRAEYFEHVKNFHYDKAYLKESGYTTPNPDFKLADYLPDAVMLDSSQPDGISPYDYDWWGEGTRTGSIFENRLSLSGGNDNVSYLVSFENLAQEGYIVNDDFKRNSIRVNLDLKPYKWMKFGVQAFGSFVNQDGAEPTLSELIIQNPLIRAYDDDGNLVANPFNTVELNPFIGSDIEDKERHNTFFANIYAEINLPLKGLTYRMNFGNNYRIDEHFQASKYGAGLTGQALKEHASYYDYTIDNILNYNNTFGDHSVAATLLYGASERKYNYTLADSRQFDRLILGYNALQLGKNQYTTSNAWEEALLYQMGRVNYKFKDRYLATMTVRRDGFSGFAQNNKTAVFPSVALAWILSEESFFNVPWVDHLKLRGGWGISGNLTERYKSLATVSSGSGYIFGDGGSTAMVQRITSMGNNDLKWEKTDGFNVGLDFTVLNQRLSGTIEAYQTTTRDLLYDMAIPTLTGFRVVSSNIGKIRNKGIELTLNSRNIITKDFEWNTTFNISSNSNKIISLLGKDNDGDGKEDDLISSGLFIGESISSIYDYDIEGIWQLDDKIPAGYYPGNYKIRDVTGEGELTADDRTIIGKGDPAYRFGLMNKFRYKNFTFSFFINSVQGGKNGYLGANSGAVTRLQADVRRNRFTEQAKDYWSPRNPNATYSMAEGRGTINVQNIYLDRSFIRLQDVNLTYTLPKKWLGNVGIEHLDLFFSGKNLFTITDWKGWDPETNNSEGKANGDYNGRPVLRSFTFGLNITL